jgi:opacity protein-like surface antigen
MKRTLLLCVFTLVTASAPVFADHSPLAIDEEIGVKNGAEYAMFVPAAWNGRLVLYAHGFIDPEAPIALPDVAPPDVAPRVVQLRETLLGAGFAVAYSSYAENGWAVKDGSERTHELRDLFMTSFGVPAAYAVRRRGMRSPRVVR